MEDLKFSMVNHLQSQRTLLRDLLSHHQTCSWLPASPSIEDEVKELFKLWAMLRRTTTRTDDRERVHVARNI